MILHTATPHGGTTKRQRPPIDLCPANKQQQQQPPPPLSLPPGSYSTAFDTLNAALIDQQRAYSDMSGSVNPTALWPNGMPSGDEDFADFLDFGINFGQFGGDGDGTDQQQQQGHSTQDGGNDITMEDFSSIQQNYNSANSQQAQHMQQHLQVQGQAQNMGLSTVFEHHSQQGIYGRQLVPPTPSSLELHAGAHNMTSFMDQQGNVYQSINGDPMVFTPLVSPAVTPLDTSFRVPEYSVSGAYFSPLTSPALDAQALGYMHRKLPKSPVDPPESSNLNPNQRRSNSSRRKSVTMKTPTARVVRESPSMKPQPGRRKTNPVVPSLELTDAAIAEVASQSPRTPASRRGGLKIPVEIVSSRDSSSADSISPEPLSESLMPPPPAPSSTHGRSPMLAPQPVQEVQLPGPAQSVPTSVPENKPIAAAKAKGKPATPASLMNMPKGLAPKGSGGEVLPATLVASVTEKRSSGTASPLDEQLTPRLSAIQRSSASATPSSSPMIEPKPAGGDSCPPSGSLKARKDGKGGHSKRSSISASPALQPKISPSIKPLLPEGLSASQSALILASKSNYEHIVSGNHSQLGLSYPEHLATNLTHKRTSHKIAEQGRRNRINSALAEIASLLPRSTPEKSTASDAGGNAQAGSKASTVELAIEYIKELKTNLDETTNKLAAVEAELAALKLEKGIPLQTSTLSVDMDSKGPTET